ncbi:MAG TPA: adenylate/guanylate cyclase domain-containing protein [Candidatus Binatia bacterium]|nr:adenylate/guanylate cyclase domain-containing protein [Candidatus Binatia bacterium]
MRCPQCQHENPLQVKFCHDCGTALLQRCAGCQAELAPGVKFCGECGRRVQSTAAPRPAAASDLAPLGAPPAAVAAPGVQPEPPRRRYRLAAIDWLLLSTLLPIALFGFVMTVVHGVRGDFVRVPFLVNAGPHEQYPVVDLVSPSPNGAACPIAVGDRLLRIEGIDLRGISIARYIPLRDDAGRATRSLRVTIERDGIVSDVQVPLVPGANVPGFPWWAPLPFILSLMGTAILLLVRASHWVLARRFYVAALLFAIVSAPYFGSPISPRLGTVFLVLVYPLAYGLVLWILFDFAPGAERKGRAQRTVVWTLSLLLAVSNAADRLLPRAGVAAILARVGGLTIIVFIIANLVALTRAYRRSDLLGRRQIKWVVYGFYVGLLPMGAFAAVDWLSGFLGFMPAWENALHIVAVIANVAVPLGILAAVVFYQFLDIDRLFSATLSYSLLAILAIAVALSVMPTASRAASDVLGVDPGSGQILFALALATILVPAQRVVRPQIDRFVFPERVALERAFEALLTEISSCADTQELTRLVGDRLDALLHPVSAVVYANAGDLFTPLAVRGRAAPPAFTAHSALIAALQERTTPLAAERWTARHATSLTPFERAAIETLDVAVLVPFRRGPDLVAFSCLGPKRSGDIYTPTDLAWLGAVAGKISDRLLSLEATAVTEQARAMQAALRRYVPGAVAERVVSGKAVDAGEREVTVLFVDIRGYTGFSEAREAEEIFHTVNRYTETVSRLVQARGGVVVEFTGDGMMAVFGAPDELPMKERAAVQVARDIVAAMADLPAPIAHSTLTLSVGVGIGTGSAFVGNIQSSDRFIWTVIGNTVNLAARLQSMTRELHAAVAIDDTTFHRAGRGACADFVRHADLPIRGRAAPETVHALPLA